eukprot:NODE_376_length_8513_cov_1.020086.p8 type:complete len:117 gc:universal NODE_376_length_8513_cov_1.020086:4595-4245(-)
MYPQEKGMLIFTSIIIAQSDCTDASLSTAIQNAQDSSDIANRASSDATTLITKRDCVSSSMSAAEYEQNAKRFTGPNASEKDMACEKCNSTDEVNCLTRLCGDDLTCLEGCTAYFS